MRKAVLLVFLLITPVVNAAQPPETVLTFFRPKSGHEADLLAVIREARTVYERLDVVTGPHVLYRASDELGAAGFVEIFTWKSGDIPDNAPPEIRAVWAKMQPLVEKRNGRAGIEFYALDPLSAGSSLPAAAPSR